MHLEVPDDGRLCRKIANDSYFASGEARQSGARCIETEVVNGPQARLVEKWFEVEGKSEDAMNSGPFMQFRAEVQELGQGDEIIKVVRDEDISAPRQV